MIFASGRSTRQVISLAQNLADKIKLKFDIVSRIEGKEQGEIIRANIDAKVTIMLLI